MHMFILSKFSTSSNSAKSSKTIYVHVSQHNIAQPEPNILEGEEKELGLAKLNP